MSERRVSFSSPVAGAPGRHPGSHPAIPTFCRPAGVRYNAP
jgi:hypothetical protein